MEKRERRVEGTLSSCYRGRVAEERSCSPGTLVPSGCSAGTSRPAASADRPGSAGQENFVSSTHKRWTELHGRQVTIGKKGTWEIKIRDHRVGRTNDFRYLELSLIGPTDFDLTLEVVKTETTGGVLDVIRAFLDQPSPQKKCTLRLKSVSPRKTGKIVVR